MAYTAPTVADFKRRYPEFARVATGRIAAVLAEAALEVGETWIEAHRAMATMCLAAHSLAEGGALNSSSGMVSSVAPGTVIEQHAGDTGMKFAASASTQTSNASTNVSLGYSRTPYGLRFLELRSRSFPAIGVVASFEISGL